MYFGDIGENSRCLIGYFEEHGATSCGPDENPAEWILKVIGAAPGAEEDRDWAEVWRNSQEYSHVQRQLSDLGSAGSTTSPPDADMNLDTTYATPFRTQFIMCTKRVFEQYWRTPSYIYSKLILCGGTASFPRPPT